MSEHTKGPWAVSYSKFSEVRAENGAVIARCVRLTSLANLEANARRIAACVNACEGVRTEHLENNLPIVELAGRHSEALREIEALKADQAELLEALKALVNDFGRDGYGGEFEDGECRVIDTARAAIAKATRGGK